MFNKHRMNNKQDKSMKEFTANLRYSVRSILYSFSSFDLCLFECCYLNLHNFVSGDLDYCFLFSAFN